MPDTLKLYTSHEVRAQLQRDHPQWNITGNHTANMITFSAAGYGFQLDLHRLSELPHHDLSITHCDICRVSAEAAVSDIIIYLDKNFTKWIQSAVTSREYVPSSKRHAKLKARYKEVATHLSDEVAEMLKRLVGQSAFPDVDFDAVGVAAMNAAVIRFLPELINARIDLIHQAFGWRCPSNHMSGDDS